MTATSGPPSLRIKVAAMRATPPTRSGAAGLTAAFCPAVIAGCALAAVGSAVACESAGMPPSSASFSVCTASLKRADNQSSLE